jgi:hypothetical protein
MNSQHGLNIAYSCLYSVTETFKGKMIDMLEKLMHPTDETAEKIKSALTSSPGEYEAVPVDLMIDSDVDIQPTQAQKATVKIKGSLQSGLFYIHNLYQLCITAYMQSSCLCVAVTYH